MFIAYVVTSLVLAAYLTFSSWADFTHFPQVLVAMARANVPASWLPLLGTLKGAAAVGLVLGLGIPLLSTAAALGVVVFFVGAIVVHVRSRFYSFAFAGSFLVLAVAVLGLGLLNLDVLGAQCDLLVRGCAA